MVTGSSGRIVSGAVSVSVTVSLSMDPVCQRFWRWSTGFFTECQNFLRAAGPNQKTGVPALQIDSETAKWEIR